jgi:hypothetical protein
VNSQCSITINYNCCLLFFKNKIVEVKIEVAESEITWSEENAEDTMLLRLVIITGPIVIVARRVNYCFIAVRTHVDATTKQPKQWQSVVAMLSRDCRVWELG